MAEAKKIEAIIGQQIQITLQSMAGSTGYSWFLSKLDGGLSLSSAYSVPVPANPGVIGPVNQIFEFLAVKDGKFEVVFDLIAPWRPEEPADTETYDVSITEPKKTAAEEIESAMKEQSFISASAVNVGSPTTSTVMKYAAPMSQCASTAGPTTQPVILYAAPVTQASSFAMGASTQPVILYAAPVTQTSCFTMGAATQPVIMYAAPVTQASSFAMGASTQPVILYAAPTPRSFAAPAVDPGWMVTMSAPYAAPVQYGGAAAAMIPYAAPAVPSAVAAQPADAARMAMASQFQCPQPMYAAPITQPPDPLTPYLDQYGRAAAAMVAYAAPVGPSTMAAQTAYASQMALAQQQAGAARMAQASQAPAAAGQAVPPVIPTAMACSIMPYAAPITRQVLPEYAAPMASPVQPMYAAPVASTMMEYAAPRSCC